ncbi:hypothetical protein VTK73DRAFT_5774 [Phialemonium thermophilum]|uniref:Cullin family profile domain-containing protein n=1 Tax=Phialemonium thermophilum TaxID=223376 RepID=A0ABR3WM13_9PEZI
MASRSRIRPPRRPIVGRGDGSEFEPCWELLRSALIDIHNKNAGNLSFEQLYRASYKIVLRKNGQLLYDHVKAFEEQWFADHVLPRIQGLLSKHLVSLSLLQLPSSSLAERRQLGEKFLRGVRDAWEDHNMSMNMIADILMYLDRTYTKETGRPSTWTATIGLFRDHVLRSSLGRLDDVHDGEFVIFDIVNAVVLDQINMEREGDVIDRALVRAVTYMLEVLYESDLELANEKLYITVFEPRFLEDSRRFYAAECQKLARESDASTWLRHSQRRLLEEQDRCSTTISPLTMDKIAAVVEKELVLARMDEFLAMEGSGVRSMLDNDRVEDLAILYQLLCRVDPKKTALKVALQNRVTELGLEIERALKNTDFSVQPQQQPGANNDEEGGAAAEVPEKAKAQQPLTVAAQQTAAAIKWVDDVLKLKDKFDYLWTHCFNEDLVLQSALAKSFSEFINMFHRSSEFVSLFIDDVLRRGIKGKTEAEVDQLLDKAIVLLRYLSDRDMFERYYQKHLAKRLLQGKSESQDVEKEMISRMKQEMGNHFTSKFEGMFKDMDLSRDLAEGYRSHIRSLGEVDTRQIDLAISVLTTNNWPPDIMGRSSATEVASSGSAKSDCIYPPEIKRLQSSFYKYYLKDRSGRILTWVGTAGTADVKCVFPKIPGKESGPLSKERRYELNVSTYGMIVLLLFNDLPEGQWLSFEEIQAKTNIPVPDLVRTLTSLSVAPKSRVLLKDPATRAVKPGDRFSFHAAFVSKSIKIKAPTISNISKVEGEDERKETEKKNDQTRAHVVDAAIVRIMKQRKELSHQSLITEVISQLAGRFKPDVSLIKKRIEDLLAREYLDRGEEPGTYVYVA